MIISLIFLGMLTIAITVLIFVTAGVCFYIGADAIQNKKVFDSIAFTLLGALSVWSAITLITSVWTAFF